MNSFCRIIITIIIVNKLIKRLQHKLQAQNELLETKADNAQYLYSKLPELQRLELPRSKL